MQHKIDPRFHGQVHTVVLSHCHVLVDGQKKVTQLSTFEIFSNYLGHRSAFLTYPQTAILFSFDISASKAWSSFEKVGILYSLVTSRYLR